MSHFGLLAIAMVLDAIFGEPKWLWSRVPHPAVLMGRAIGWADARFNTGTARRAKGLLLTISLTLAALALGAVISHLGAVVEVLVIAVLLAQKSLAEHVAAVATALRKSLAEGRNSVAMIVGRDTGEMDGPAVTRAAIESAAENLSDGVIAPLFWYALLGLPGLIAYKIVNTADSMIGYKTPKHQDFGWAAARFDDLLNLIPARLTAGLILLSHWTRADIRDDAAKHRSPNAGWPEAAMAHVLSLALAGPRSYEGRLQTFPWVHETGRKNGLPRDIEAAVSALWRTWALALAAVVILSLL